MSVKVMSWVWEQDLPTTKKMLLLAIADHADDYGENAWPTKGRLAKKVGVEPNRIRQLLRELEADHWIETIRQRGGTLNTPSDRRPNLYKINTQRGLIDDAPQPSGGHWEAPRGVTGKPSRGLTGEPLIISDTSSTSFGSQKRARKPDTIFDALVLACGLDPAGLTSSARGATNKAVKELREVDATPESILRVARAYQQKWPDLSMSPTSIAKHYPSLVGANTPKREIKKELGVSCESCKGSGWFDESETEVGPGVVVRCGDCEGSGFALPQP